MAGTIWPVDAVTGAPSYTGRMLRETLSVLAAGATAARPFGGVSGVRPGTSTTIATATSTTWTVTPFAGLIDGEASNLAGVYAYAFPANQTGSVTAAGGSARVDRLDVQVSDPAEGDGTSVPTITIVYTVGTGGTGVPNAAPARSHPLVYINVPASGGGSPTVSWVAPYVAAAGGTVASATKALLPTAGSYPNQRSTVFADPTVGNNGDYLWSGTAWAPANPVPLLTPASAAVIGTGTVVQGATSISFTNATGIRLSGISAAGFDRIRVIWQGTATAAADARFQFSSGGTPLATNYYYRVSDLGSSITLDSVNNFTYMKVGALAAGGASAFDIDFEFSNMSTTKSKMFKLTSSNDGPGARVGGGVVNVPTAYTDFDLSPASGTVTGTLRIYGYNA
jgi:hypothetical protein